MLTDVLDQVGQGLLGIPLVQMPSYPGLFNLWDYMHDFCKVLITSLDMVVKLAEDEVQVIASTGVPEVLTLGGKYLPKGVECSQCVLMPEAMFSTHCTTCNSKQKVFRNSAVISGGMLASKIATQLHGGGVFEPSCPSYPHSVEQQGIVMPLVMTAVLLTACTCASPGQKSRQPRGCNPMFCCAAAGV
jgi:hypothetical protein